MDSDGIAQLHIDFLLSGLESRVHAGSVFRAGETFQHGWMITLVHELDDGSLTLHEPDMISMPIKFVPGVTEAIRHMMLQLFTLDSFSVNREQMEIPTVVQSGIACNRYGVGDGFTMDRGAPSDDNDSGWFVGCADPDCEHGNPDNLQRISLFQLLLDRPEIRHWVAFPTGTLIQYRDGELVVDCDGQRLEIVPDSFMDQMLRQANS